MNRFNKSEGRELPVATYEVEYKSPQGRAEETFEATSINESKDGVWLVFGDDLGEVKRYRADIVYRVGRVDKK